MGLRPRARFVRAWSSAIKTNQGLGRTNRNKKKDKITKPKPNQTKPKKKKKSHTSKDLCTDINDGLREPKESGWTANIPSVPYFSYLV